MDRLLELLRGCDRARYQGEPITVFADLHEAVLKDPAEARVLMETIPSLTHCHRCVMRWRSYLYDALAAGMPKNSRG